MRGRIAGRGLAVSSDGRLVATSDGRDLVRLRTSPSLTEIYRWFLADLGDGDLACAVAFTPDKSGLMVAGWEGVIGRIALPAPTLSDDLILGVLGGHARGLTARH